MSQGPRHLFAHGDVPARLADTGAAAHAAWQRMSVPPGRACRRAGLHVA